MDDDLRELMADVPDLYAARFAKLAELTNLRDGRVVTRPIKGTCLGRVNFLQDPSQTPHMKSTEIAEGSGVSMATIHAKAKVLRKGLNLMPLHPDWCLPSRLDHNPLVWMLEVNGFLMDIRAAPRGAQVAAYEQGLIPYVPADQQGAAMNDGA